MRLVKLPTVRAVINHLINYLYRAQHGEGKIQLEMCIRDSATTDIASLTTSFVLKLGGVYLVLRLIDAAANYYICLLYTSRCV